MKKFLGNVKFIKTFFLIHTIIWKLPLPIAMAKIVKAMAVSLSEKNSNKQWNHLLNSDLAKTGVA